MLAIAAVMFTIHFEICTSNLIAGVYAVQK